MRRHDLDFEVTGSSAEEVEEKAHKVLADYFGEGNYFIDKIDTTRSATISNFAGQNLRSEFRSSVTGRKNGTGE